MQFTVLINQSRALEWGLNAQQAMLFAFLFTTPTWAEATELNGIAYCYVSKSKVCEEMPLLTDKPNTVYRLMKQLEEFGLIYMACIENKTHIAITKRGATWNSSENIQGVGKKSEPVKKIITGSEKNQSGVGKISDQSDNQYQITKSDNQDIKKINKKDLAAELFEFWKTTMGHSKARLDDKRLKLITKALDLGYSVDDLKSAIAGCAKSEYHMGNNDNGTVYDDLGLILRDAGKIDSFIKKASQVTPHATSQQFSRPGAGRPALTHADDVRGQARRAFERRHGGHGAGTVRSDGGAISQQG